MAARVFTEWTCEGSLKLPDMIREEYTLTGEPIRYQQGVYVST